MKIQIQRPRSCCKVASNSIVNQIICSPESDCNIYLHAVPSENHSLRISSCLSTATATATSTRSQTKHLQLCQHAKPVSMAPASAGSCSQLSSHPLLAATPTSAYSLWQPAPDDTCSYHHSGISPTSTSCPVPASTYSLWQPAVSPV